MVSQPGPYVAGTVIGVYGDYIEVDFGYDIGLGRLSQYDWESYKDMLSIIDSTEKVKAIEDFINLFY